MSDRGKNRGPKQSSSSVSKQGPVGSQSILSMFQRQQAMNQVCKQLSETSSLSLSAHRTQGVSRSAYFTNNESNRLDAAPRRRLSKKHVSKSKSVEKKKKESESHGNLTEGSEGISDMKMPPKATEWPDKCPGSDEPQCREVVADEVTDRTSGDAQYNESNHRGRTTDHKVQQNRESTGKLRLRKRKSSNSYQEPNMKRQNVETDANSQNASDVIDLTSVPDTVSHDQPTTELVQVDKKLLSGNPDFPSTLISPSTSSSQLQPSISLDTQDVQMDSSSSTNSTDTGVQHSVSLANSDAPPQITISVSDSSAPLQPSISVSSSSAPIPPSISVSDSNAPLQPNISVSDSSAPIPPSTSMSSREVGVEGPSDGDGTFTVPYYLENFQLVLTTVLEDEFYAPLFNQEDLHAIEAFKILSEEGQKLYIRLFQRKYKWFRQGKISYPQIAEDLGPTLQELCKVQFLDDDSSLNDLGEVLQHLPAPDLRSLAKTLRLNVSGQQKDIVAAVLKHAKGQHLSTFFKQSKGGTAATVLKRAKSLLGACYKLRRTPRAVFVRCMMLFCLHHTSGDDDEAAGGHQELVFITGDPYLACEGGVWVSYYEFKFQILKAKIGVDKYPEYQVLKQAHVFETREDLLRFESSIQLEYDIATAMEEHKYEAALQIYAVAKAAMEDLWTNEKLNSFAKSLPLHLRVMTVGSVYTRILTYGVEALQKHRRYKEAVSELESLIGQPVYQLTYRGRWYERLALNLDQHLKQPQKALDVIAKALADEYVRTGHRLALFQRAQRLCHSPVHKKLHSLWEQFEGDSMAQVQEPVKVTIQCRQVDQAALGTLGVCRFITEESLQGGSTDITFFKQVEDVVLSHYKDNGYPKGIHGEGRTFLFLFKLLMWDIVFQEGIPDVFLNPYQTCPLDINTRQFYEMRKEQFDERLDHLSKLEREELADLIGERWEQYEGVMCSGVNWELFDDVTHCQGLVRCLGGSHLSGILQRMAADLRNTTGGVPDLIVWNTDTGQVKISEVKGPGDRLSTKQILWLDYLTKLGMDAEVCHVEAVGIKKLKK